MTASKFIHKGKELPKHRMECIAKINYDGDDYVYIGKYNEFTCTWMFLIEDKNQKITDFYVKEWIYIDDLFTIEDKNQKIKNFSAKEWDDTHDPFTIMDANDSLTIEEKERLEERKEIHEVWDGY